MALDPKGAALALHRFGFGPRAASIAALAPDPREAVLAELERPNAGRIVNAKLRSSGEANRAVFEFNAERNARQRQDRTRREAAIAAGETPPAMENNMAAPPAARRAQGQGGQVPIDQLPIPQQNFLMEAQARFLAAINADVGFVERLVWFWSNHFCVNADATMMAGAYEREAIRPHVLGRFADMLLAAESHPAMLLYLDNAQSMGPNSVSGINITRGLNENLAREILELHTLGVRTVYAQADVTNFAKVLTGWSFLGTATNPDHGGEFIFFKRMHEPGPQTVVDKVYADNGIEQGRAVLADLARHRATAEHIAVKLARHFIADDPPPALVKRLKQRFLDTDGGLKEVAKTLVTSPEAWNSEQVKIKRPGEWLIAIRRATGIPGEVRRSVAAFNRLGEPLWRPPAPKGFSDENAAWLDGLSHRLDTANAFAQGLADQLDPEAVAETALGPLASPATRQLIARAESKTQALTFLLMSPEFQRR